MAILKIRNENGNMVEVPALVGTSAYQIAVKNGFKGNQKVLSNIYYINNIF